MRSIRLRKYSSFVLKSNRLIFTVKSHLYKFLFFLIPKTTLYVTFDEGVKIEVKNTASWIPGFPAQRYIQVNGKGAYSAIYMDSKKSEQPYLQTFQEAIKSWTKEATPKCALILGSAGCTLHRFLALTYEGISLVSTKIR